MAHIDREGATAHSHRRHVGGAKLVEVLDLSRSLLPGNIGRVVLDSYMAHSFLAHSFTLASELSSVLVVLSVCRFWFHSCTKLIAIESPLF